MGSKKKQNRKEQSKKKKKKNEEEKEDGGGGSENLITDPRFASVHSDPRFANLPKHKSKVAIDSRFDQMFTDKNFSISSSAHIDKRGKPKKKDSSQNPLKHYYRLEEEEKEETKNEDEVSEEREKSEEELVEPGGDLSDLDLESESDEEESEDDEEERDDVSSDTTDSNEEDEISEEEKENNNLIQEENVPEIDKETHRLAVVNLDWGHVKAVDLYVLLSSFLPKEGQILSVAVYPSEYGLKRMEEELVRGPVGLFDDDKEQNDSDDSDDDDEIDEEKLRAYELSRLRYYYAVVECDSIATADYLYKTCDGVEFERSSNKLDLRFIPDSLEFKHAPRDVAKEAPADYEGLDFHTRALQHSNIQLTWDEDEPQRVKTLKRKFNADQLAELELKEFLASDESETDGDENDDATEDQPEKKIKRQDLYRALLQSGQGSDEENDDENQDMEVTFNTDLEDLNKHIIEKKDKKSETVWEAHLRKSREKKKARRNRSKNSSEDESSDADQEPKEEPGDFFIEETGRSTGGQGKSDLKGRKHQGTVKEAKASIAELELLMADDNEADASLKGYNLKPKKDKVEKKRKKVKQIPDEEKIPTMDYDDPRFTALFTSPLYALDPTDPQFKRSATYARQLAQKQRKGDREELDSMEQEKLPRPAHLPSNDLNIAQNEHLSSKKAKHELSAMVRSIKMKSQQVQFAPSDKITGKNKKLGSKINK